MWIGHDVFCETSTPRGVLKIRGTFLHSVFFLSAFVTTARTHSRATCMGLYRVLGGLGLAMISEEPKRKAPETRKGNSDYTTRGV